MKHPALVEHLDKRGVSDRIADGVTAFSGSMVFVYIHIAWFALWLILHSDINLLTMIVSLEAIFLATFVLISQNRADIKRHVLADAQWAMVQQEDIQNQQLIEISDQILELTKAVHAATVK
jgi:uncharacterized membrane protein